jgi:hypothetical protein
MAANTNSTILHGNVTKADDGAAAKGNHIPS